MPTLDSPAPRQDQPTVAQVRAPLFVSLAVPQLWRSCPKHAKSSGRLFWTLTRGSV